MKTASFRGFPLLPCCVFYGSEDLALCGFAVLLSMFSVMTKRGSVFVMLQNIRLNDG